MKNKSKILTSIAILGSAIFAMVLTTGSGVFEALGLFGKNRTTTNSYGIELSNSKNDYTGNGSQSVATDLGNPVTFSFSGCTTASDAFANVSDGGYFGNSIQVTSIESIYAVFSSADNATFEFRASFDKSKWGEYATLTSEKTFSLASHPYYLQFRANGGAVKVESINIKFTCVANPDAESHGSLEPTAFSPEIKETSDYSGTYLVGCDTTGLGTTTKIFDSSLDTLDAEGNLINNVAVNNDGTINYSADLAGKAITLSKIVKKGTNDVYSVKTSSGLYIGRSTYANGLETSTEPIENTVELNDGILEIYGSGGCILAFNNNTTGGNRFRYMKEISDKNLQVTCYKLNSESSGTSGKPNYEAGILHTDTKSYKVTDKFADFVDNSGLNVSILMSDNTHKVVNKSQYKYSVTFNGEEISPSNTFPHAGIYVVTITYGQLCPVKYEISVANVTNSIVAYKDKTSYNLNDTINTNDLSAILWYFVDGTSNEIAYSNFGSYGLSVSLLNPTGNVVPLSNQLNAAGAWKLRVSLNSDVYYDITINVASIDVTSITLNKSTSSLYVGETDQLSATISPANATDKTVTWTTTSSAIASVSNGLITANAPGTATITAKAGSEIATCTVNVSAIAVTGVSISDTTKDLRVGDQYTLVATINPGNATNKSVTWTVTSGDSVTITNDGVVSAIKAGTSVVQVKTNDGNKTATCTITVSNVAVTDISLSPKSLTLYKDGDKGSLTATISPANATDKSVTWSTTNASVAAIVGSGSSVQINPVGSGTATITATSSNGLTDTCEVVVSDSVPTWELVTEYSDLVAGSKYVLAQNVEGVTAGEISGSFLTSVDTTFSSDKSTINSLGQGTVQFTLSGSDGNWKFSNDDNQTLGTTGAKNVGWNNGTDTWDITLYEDNDVTIASTESSKGSFLYNVSSPRFVTYTSGASNTMLYPQLYVLKHSGGSTDVLVNSISVQPESATLDPGETLPLSATVLPATATNKSIAWSTSDKDVATVSSSGVVTAVGTGTATIIATAKDGSGVTGTTTITVTEAQLTSIEVSNVKVNYTVGDSFVKPTVTAHFSDGTTTNATYDASFSGFNSSTAGNCTVTVSYTHNGVTKTTAFTVTITSSVTPIIDGDEYQITFKSNGSDSSTNLTSATFSTAIATGSSYILSYNSMDKVYLGTNGLKMGSSSSKGYFDFNTTSAISENEATSIRIDVAQYGTSGGAVNVYINNGVDPILSVDPSVSESGTASIPSNTLVDRIKVISSQRSYLKGITLSTKPVEPVNPNGISVDPSTLVLTRGETSKLGVTFTPANTNQNKAISWTSSNTNVATVGTDGTVTAKANGSATITATGYGGITSTCNVTVKDIDVTGISVSPTTATVSVGATKQLTATISPYNATNQGVTWSTSNQMQL